MEIVEVLPVICSILIVLAFGIIMVKIAFDRNWIE